MVSFFLFLDRFSYYISSIDLLFLLTERRKNRKKIHHSKERKRERDYKILYFFFN